MNKPLWITGSALLKLANGKLNKFDLIRIRLDNPNKGFYRQEGDRSFRYDFNKFSGLLKQENIES